MSLLPLVDGKSAGRREVFSSARAVEGRHQDRGYLLDPNRRILSVRTDRWKLIEYPGLEQDYLELFDLELDPAEMHNVAPDNPGVRDAFLALLQDWYRDADSGDKVPTDLNPEDRKRLEALGYLGD